MVRSCSRSVSSAPASQPEVTLERALSGLLLDVASHSEPQADEQVPAAVLVPLYEAPYGELRVVLTKRRADLRRHAGEISFPGGRRDPADATLSETALREAEEEIGLARAEVTVIGSARAHLYLCHQLCDPPVRGPARWGAGVARV